MSASVSEQTILDALHRIPHDRWGDVLTFIDALHHGDSAPEVEKRPMTAADLLSSNLFGLWANRTDIDDSREFARRLREQAQSRSPG